MVTIFICSTYASSGKSIVTLGLMNRLVRDGLNPGFFKPFGRVPEIIGGKLVDGDAAFIKKTFGLRDGLGDICPVVYSTDLEANALKGKGVDYEKSVMAAYNKVSKGRDAVVVGGARDIRDGSFMGVSASRLVPKMDARVVIVDPYDGEVSVDKVLDAKEEFGERLLGVVINKTPPDGLEHVAGMVGPFFKKKGIPLLGVLPADKGLMAITVERLIESVGGRVLTKGVKLDGMVEALLIGAMDVEGALRFFRKTPNKAVITGGHRADVQLAALETSTACLVLTGNMQPNDLILAKAEEKGVPVVLARGDTLSTVNMMEAAIGKVRIREGRRVEEAAAMLEGHFNFKALYRLAGLAGRK